MKPKTVPTSPKGRKQSDSLENIYNVKKLSQLDQPLRVRLGWSIGLLVIILSVVAGLFGAVIFDWLIYNNPHWSLWQRLNIATAPTTTIETTTTIDSASTRDWDQALQKALNNTVQIFPKRLGEGLWNNIYRPIDRRGNALILSTDGLLVTIDDYKLSSEEQLVAITKNGDIYEIKSIINDPASPYTFLTTEGNDLTPTQFVTEDQIEFSQSILELDPDLLSNSKAKIINITNNNYQAKQLLNSDNLSRLITTSNNDDNNKGRIYLTQSGDIIGMSNDSGHVAPLFHISNVLTKALSEELVERPYLGVNYIDVNTPGLVSNVKKPGAYVTSGPDGLPAAVEEDSPAAEGLLQTGDVIISVDDDDILIGSQLSEIIQSKHIGDTILIKYIRDEIESEIEITLGKLP
ncbi:PDZ domain-containing protein [Patescibacteria group bacterium]